MEGTLLGHIVMGAKYIDKIGTEIGMPYEKMIMVEHMVVSHHYEPDFGSPKRPMFPEAEVLHYCDILDARLFDMRRSALRSREDSRRKYGRLTEEGSTSRNTRKRKKSTTLRQPQKILMMTSLSGTRRENGGDHRYTHTGILL